MKHILECELISMKLSLVVPCYNEAENVAAFQDAVINAFDGCGYDYEIVFVDDGSKDATLHNLRKLHKAQRCPVKVISFSRNFGKEAGIYAGMQQADGEYISLIDADLQQRPEIVRDMVKILDEQEDYDVVAAYQDRRGEGKVLSFFKKSFYNLINRLSTVKLQSDASDFRTFRRSVRDSILDLAEYHRFSKGIFAWVGYNTCFIPYTACERHAGTTKWNFRKLLNYAIDGIIGYSTAPLRLATYLGGLSGLAAAIYMIVVLLQKLIWGIEIPGYATIIMLILFFGCVQLLCIGIIGEYVGRTFEQSKNRPIYIAKEVLSYEKE
jgi:glycosyltransferase involved in cell wall biosynthesis